MTKIINIVKCTCPHCGNVHSSNKREINLIKQMVIGLFRVSTFLKEKNVTRAKKIHFKHLLTGDSMSMRFPDWHYLAPELLHRVTPTSRIWDFNFENIDKFFRGELSVTLRAWLLNGLVVDRSEVGTIDRVPNMSEFLDGDEYVVRYKK